MNELQSVTDIDEVIKYAEREAEGCHQTASAFHTDEGVYIHEETRFQYKAILWENIHEWLEELKELRKKQRPHGERNNTERADLLSRLYSWKMNNPMLHEERELLDECIAHLSFEPKGSHEKWERLKEHITEMRDADGSANQTETCKFILNLMSVIEREGEASDKTSDNR